MDMSVRTETIGQDDQSWLGSRHGTNSGRTITLDKTTFVSGTHYPGGYIPSGTALGRITASGKYGPYAGRTNEVQTITVTAATGGTFTISFDGVTTAAIAYDAAASAVQAALLATPAFASGDITVTGDAGGPYTLTFAGRYAGVNVAACTVTDSTTGTGHTITVATTTTGGTGADGREILAGFLLTPVSTAGGGANLVAVLLDHGRVVEASLPFALDAAGRTDVTGRIAFM